MATDARFSRVDLKRIDFSAAGTRKLDLGKDQDHIHAGDATDQFVTAAPFAFLGLKD